MPQRARTEPTIAPMTDEINPRLRLVSLGNITSKLGQPIPRAEE
jgi:hypothetical protein